MHGLQYSLTHNFRFVATTKAVTKSLSHFLPTEQNNQFILALRTFKNRGFQLNLLCRQYGKTKTEAFWLPYRMAVTQGRVLVSCSNFALRIKTPFQSSSLKNQSSLWPISSARNWLMEVQRCTLSDDKPTDLLPDSLGWHSSMQVCARSGPWLNLVTVLLYFSQF